jgi:hypothetical protein
MYAATCLRPTATAQRRNISMPNIDLTNVKEVTETLSKDRVNELLKQGWVLIDSASGKDESDYPLIKYSLGKV